MLANKRSVYTGAMLVGDVIVPIAIYKTVDVFGLPGQQYHQDCGGKIRQSTFCELHPEDETPVIYSAIGIGDMLLPVGPEVRDTLLERKCAFEVVSAHPLKAISDVLGTMDMLPMETYEIAPQKTKIVPAFGLQNDLLHTLLSRMKTRKLFLMCRVGLCGMQRYAMLMPTGRLIVLAYNEEVRQSEDWSGEVNREMSIRFDSVFNRITDEYPKLSLEVFNLRIREWITAQISDARKPKREQKSRNPKKNAKKKVSA